MDIDQLPQILSPFNNLTNIKLSCNRIYLEHHNTNLAKQLLWSLFIFCTGFFIYSLLSDSTLIDYVHTGLWGQLVIICVVCSIIKFDVIDLNNNTLYSEYTIFKFIKIYKTAEIDRKDILFVSNNLINTFPYLHNKRDEDDYQTVILSKRKDNFNYKEIRPILKNSKTNLFHQYGLCFLVKDGIKNVFLENANYNDSIKIASSIADYWQLKQFTCLENYKIKSITKTDKGIRLNDEMIPYAEKYKKILMSFKYHLLFFLIFFMFWGPFLTTVEFQKTYKNSHFSTYQKNNESILKKYFSYLIKNKFGINNVLTIMKGIALGRR